MKKYLLICCCFIILLEACKDDNAKNIPSTYIANLQKQVAQNPDSTRLRLVLVNTLDSAGFYKDALAQMDILISKDSLNNAFWFKKGMVQEHAADTANAIISYNRAVRIYPSIDVLLSLANMYAETRNNKTMAVCATIQQLYPDREHLGEAAFFEGVYNARIGNKEKALELFNTCINYNYTLMDTYVEKGALLYENKQYKEALDVFKTAATINNTYVYAYYWQGKCYEAMNNKAEAISNYEKALSIDKNFKEAAERLKALK
jgi:tetratricopeptide (TPR) repeat protein